METQPILEQDYRKLKRSFLHDTPRNHCLFTLLFTLTLRVSDLLALKIKDLVDEDGSIKDVARVKESKQDRFVNIVIRDDSKRSLRQWLKERGDYNREEYLFPSPQVKEQPLSRTHVWRIIKGKACRLGIKCNVGSHSGRKTFGRRMYEQTNKDIEKVRQALRHQSVKTTQKYIGITNEEVVEEVQAIKM